MRILAIVCCLALTGCAYKMVNQRYPNANLDEDNWTCDKEVAAMTAHPQASVPVRQQPTEYSTDCTTNGSNTRCDTKAKESHHGFASSFEKSYATSAALGGKQSCMEARGWKKVKVEQ